MGDLQLPDLLGQDWVDPSPCSTLISLDFLSSQIRAVLLPASHLAISGDCSKDRGGVRGPCNIPYGRIQVINKHRSPVKKDPGRRTHLYTCCSGSETLSYKHFDAVACAVQGQLQKWEMGYFSKSDTSRGLSQRQSKAEHQPKWVRIGPVSLRRKVACFFLSESILKASPQHTQQDGVSLVNNHMGKSDFQSLDF